MSKFLQTSVLIHGHRTDLVVQPFADRTLVFVTQVGKVGNMIQVSIPPTIDLHAYNNISSNVSNSQEPLPSLPCPHPAVQLTSIFGSAPSAHMQTLYSLYAAQIATLIWLSIGGEPHSVVIGIALQRSKRLAGEELSEDEQQTFHRVMQALQKML